MTGDDAFAPLRKSGLNLIAVFDLAGLPEGLRAAVAPLGARAPYRQLILVGHGGTLLWQKMTQQGALNAVGEDPVDDYSVRMASRFLNAAPQCRAYSVLYPHSDRAVPLIALGELAGWHHTSPFRVGINDKWGSWFAYRSLILADSDFTPTPARQTASPCDSCAEKPCINACPASVVSGGGFAADACYDHRLGAGSACAATCFARTACPIGDEHRYSEAQMRYHYCRSLDSLKRYVSGRD